MKGGKKGRTKVDTRSRERPRGGMLKCFPVFFHEMYGLNSDLGTLMVKGLPQCSM